MGPEPWFYRQTKNENQGILSTHLHSDGSEAEILSMMNPGFHAGRFVAEKKPAPPVKPYGGLFITEELVLKMKTCIRIWTAPLFFKKSSDQIAGSDHAALSANGYKTSDLSLLIPHQANLRISKFIQHQMKLRDDQVI